MWSCRRLQRSSGASLGPFRIGPCIELKPRTSRRFLDFTYYIQIRFFCKFLLQKSPTIWISDSLNSPVRSRAIPSWGDGACYRQQIGSRNFRGRPSLSIMWLSVFLVSYFWSLVVSVLNIEMKYTEKTHIHKYIFTFTLLYFVAFLRVSGAETRLFRFGACICLLCFCCTIYVRMVFFVSSHAVLYPYLMFPLITGFFCSRNFQKLPEMGFVNPFVSFWCFFICFYFVLE